MTREIKSHSACLFGNVEMRGYVWVEKMNEVWREDIKEVCVWAGGCLVVGGSLFIGLSVKVVFEWKPTTEGVREKDKKCQNRAHTHQHRVLSVAVAHLCGCGFELQSRGSDLTRLSYIWLAAQCTVTVVWQHWKSMTEKQHGESAC